VVVTDPVDAADSVEAVAELAPVAVPDAVFSPGAHAKNAAAMINGITNFFIFLIFVFY
jgi:hypothetical protein